MKREIKFRAWDGEKMLNNVGFHPHIIQKHDNYADGEDGQYTISPAFHSYTLMQFTGLFDKNGAAIFEGDIFQVANNKKYTVKYMENGTCKYELYAATFVLWFNDEMFFPFDEFAVANGKVIGNVHQNPDLL